MSELVEMAGVEFGYGPELGAMLEGSAPRAKLVVLNVWE